MSEKFLCINKILRKMDKMFILLFFKLVGGSHSESEAKEDDDLTEVGQDYVNRRNSIGCTSSLSNAAMLNASGARKKRKKKKKRGYGVRCPASSEDQMDVSKYIF